MIRWLRRWWITLGFGSMPVLGLLALLVWAHYESKCHDVLVVQDKECQAKCYWATRASDTPYWHFKECLVDACGLVVQKVCKP